MNGPLQKHSGSHLQDPSSSHSATEYKRALLWMAYEEEQFPSLRLTRVARYVRRLGRWLLAFLVLMAIAMLFAPWQQSIRGEGEVIALDPFERTQSVQAPIKGRIAERGEGVRESAYVEKGQLLFRIEDQDPMYLSRLEQQVAIARNDLSVARMRLENARELRSNNERIVSVTTEELKAMETARDELIAAYGEFVEQAQNKLEGEKSKVIAAKAKLWQEKADYERKKELYEEGIESQLKAQESEQKFLAAEAYLKVAHQDVENARNGVEGKQKERESKRQEWQAKINKVKSDLEKAMGAVSKAAIDINKISEEINQKEAKLLDQESKLAVQQTQAVYAPRDGYIQDLAVFNTSSIVKPGDQLCRIVPRTETPAVQVWVAGNDAPLIAKGRHVRLQFEGWPAVQFSGWPSVAVGTFGGEVALVDPTDNGNGKFRVVVIPDPNDAPWPEFPYLRQGVRSYSWVLLDQVSLGYEVWRRMNGFPPALQSQEKKNTSKPPKLKI